MVFGTTVAVINKFTLIVDEGWRQMAGRRVGGGGRGEWGIGDVFV